MFLSKTIHLFFAAAAMLVGQQQAAMPEMYLQPSLDELLSYECAKSVSTMVTGPDQTGPIFSDGILTLTSIEAADGSHLLIVNAGAGTYALPLEREGVNRLRFYVPTHLPGGPKAFFISYMHGSGINMRSRVFELSMHRPPPGKDELDYTSVSVSRADKMLEHFDYAIYETAGNMLTALTEGRVTRQQIWRQKAENCEHISRNSPALARTLRRDLDVVEMIVMGPKKEPKTGAVSLGRMPASVEARQF